MDLNPAVVAAYEAALGGNPHIERKKMFGMPCAFVNRQMFFGVFEDSLVARVGPMRVAALAGQPGMRVFTPMVDRPWRDYIQVGSDTPPATLQTLAAEALSWTSTLPPKEKKAKEKAPNGRARRALKAAQAEAPPKSDKTGSEETGSEETGEE